jgi:hypothetical protein
MPFVEDKQEQVLARKFVALPELEQAEPDTKELALATFRTENSIGSLISRQSVGKLPDEADTDFNPWDNFTDEEKLDEKFIDNAALADNMEELNNVRKLTLKERKDRETMSRGGAMSFAMGFGIGGVGDPVNLIPIGGAAIKTYKTGSSILKSGLVTGSVAAGSTAIQESLLHATQLERTYGESATNVSAAFLLGGVLGMTVEGLKGMGATDDTFKQIDDSMNPEAKIKNGDDSIGAARVLDDVEVKGKVARALVKGSIKIPFTDRYLFQAFDPLSRTITSDNPITRKTANFLAENPIEMDKGNVTAVESLIKIHDGKYVTALEGHLGELKNLKKRLGQTLTDTVLRRGVTKKEFNEMVAKEMRNPDPKAHPEVKNAANTWRTELYEPLKKEMIELKLLPEDVDVTTAVNYLNRSWNKQKLAANLDGFVSKTSKWLEEQDLQLFTKAKAAADEMRTATGARLAELEAIVKKGKFKEGLDLEKQDYESIARQIAQRISGSPDGRLPYDWKIGEGSTLSKSAGTNLQGPLKKRTFNIPDKLVEEFLENDIERLGARYLKQTAPDIELSRAFDGDLGMTAAEKDISDWWMGKIQKEKNPKKAVKMQKQMDQEIKDLAAMRDRMRGTYGQVDSNNPWVRTGRVIRDLNYLRFMGGVVPSSVPDVARTFAAEGFVKTLGNGIKPLITNIKQFKVAAAEAKRYGVGVDVLMGGRAEVMADVADYTQGGTAFERLVRGAAEKFGKINLMDRWTAGMKQLHAVTMQTSVINDLMKGKYDKRLGRLGIDEADAKNIAEQVKKHGQKIDGVWTSGAKNWDSPDLEKIWGAALRKESDRVIVMPGQEKPLFMSNELGKTFFQFRSFMMSATQRMLIAGIQGQDANYFGGALMLTAMGAMAYTFKQWDAGRPISDDPKVFITEGIDRSGMLGILMEMNNTLEKVSGNNYGLRPLVGASQPSSRFASRNKEEALLGPTFGSFLTTTLKVAGAGTDDNEWKESDTRAMRRLIPYQNLMILRQAFDKLEGK